MLGGKKIYRSEKAQITATAWGRVGYFIDSECARCDREHARRFNFVHSPYYEKFLKASVIGTPCV